MSRLIKAAFIGVLSVTASAAPRRCAPKPCDCEVVPAKNAWGYSLRGSRCEGTYNVPDGDPNIGLRLASLTLGDITFDSDTGAAVKISWSGPTRPNHVRVEPVTAEVFYRMDADIPSAAAAFDWPVDMLHTVGIEPEQIGATAWLGNDNERTYLPVSFSQTPSKTAPSEYVIVIVPAYNAIEATVAVVDPTSNQPLSSKTLEGGFSLQEGILFRLPRVTARQVLKLRAQAKWRAGGSKVSEFYFQTQ